MVPTHCILFNSSYMATEGRYLKALHRGNFQVYANKVHHNKSKDIDLKCPNNMFKRYKDRLGAISIAVSISNIIEQEEQETRGSSLLRGKELPFHRKILHM